MSIITEPRADTHFAGLSVSCQVFLFRKDDSDTYASITTVWSLEAYISVLDNESPCKRHIVYVDIMVVNHDTQLTKF